MYEKVFLVAILGTVLYFGCNANVVGKGGECKQYSSCGCKFDDGSKIDLSSLDHADVDYVAPMASPYFVFYNPCTDMDLGHKDTCKYASVCMYTPLRGKKKKKTFMLGSRSSADFVTYNGQQAIKYTGEDKLFGTITIYVYLTCSNDEESFVALTNTFTPQAEFRLTSKCACKNGCRAKGAEELLAGNGNYTISDDYAF